MMNKGRYIMNILIYSSLLLAVTMEAAIIKLQEPPVISFISPNQVKNIGDTVDLQCTTQNALAVPILWSKVKENNVYISSGTAVLFDDNRYSVRSNHTSSTFILRIVDLQSKDAGLYECALHIASGNRVSADVQLDIRQPIN